MFCVPELISYDRQERTNRNGTVLNYALAQMKYTFYADDGSSVSAVVMGEGMDSGDKATNKAMAIAMKYALLQTLCIPTEDMVDPDGESYTDLISTREAELAKQQSEAITFEIASKLKDLTKGMDKDAKLAFAAEHIVPLCGMANYNACPDQSKLEALLKHLNSL